MDAFNGIREFFYHMAEENSRRIGVMFLKSFQITEAAVFIQESILIPLSCRILSDYTDLRDKFNIDLHTLTGISHLFIGLWDIFGVWQFHGHLPAAR